MNHYGDNFIIVIPDTHLLHTPEQPLCGDPTCPCYTDADTIIGIANAVIDGIITADDAQRFIKGETI